MKFTWIRCPSCDGDATENSDDREVVVYCFSCFYYRKIQKKAKR